MGLGDVVAAALSIVGVTEDRVTRWLGRPCNCKRRKEKLNALGIWATRVLTGRREKAVEYLDEMIRDGGEESDDSGQGGTGDNR